MAKPKKYTGVRRFLDNRDADSYVHVRPKTKWSDASVRIADCRRVVELEFPTDDAKDIKRSRAKMRRLLDALHGLDDELARLEAEKKRGEEA